MPFQIRVAETAGFCFGVRKALDKLLDIRNKTHGPVRTLGPLIHNELVLEALKTRSVAELSPREDVAGKHVILRAHGVTPETRDALKAGDAVICDATCPKVAQVQAIVKKFSKKGYPVLIIGDKGHAEVDGLLGYAGDRGRVITGPGEAENLEGGTNVCVVAQTTQDRQVFNETVGIIKRKYTHCYEFNTICDATYERQEETRLLAVQSDLMVVVGGRNSANTKRLFEIADQHCRSIMIQSAAGLDPDMFDGVQRVGVTAGASTPAWVIRDVVDRIHAIGWTAQGPFHTVFYRGIRWMVTSFLSWAAGGAMVYAALNRVGTGDPLWIMVFLFFMLIWAWRLQGRRLNPWMDTGVIAAVTVTAVLPLIIDSTVQTATAVWIAVYLAAILLARLLFNDCLYVQADRIAGHRTLPVVLCDPTVHKVAWSAIAAMTLSVVGILFLHPSPGAASFAAAPLLNAFCLYHLDRKPNWFTLKATLALDAPLWVTALLVFALTP